MEATELKEELTCSICLNIYTNPVMLRCGHNFCQDCIDTLLDTQQQTGVYTCPECRNQFGNRPNQARNLKLRNIVELFLSNHPKQEKAETVCTYCDSPIPAAKTCLLCEASLCEKHLQKHSKSPAHVLIDPATPRENYCSIHMETLQYFCTEDAVCLCELCCKAEHHKEHQVVLLDEALDKRKEELRNVLETLAAEREEVVKTFYRLLNHRRDVDEKAAAASESVTTLFGDIFKKLTFLQHQVQHDIRKRKGVISKNVCYPLNKMELKREELSKRICDIKEFCNMTNMVTLLSHPLDVYATCKLSKDCKEKSYIDMVGSLDEAQILHKALVHLSDIMLDLKRKMKFNKLEASDL